MALKKWVKLKETTFKENGFWKYKIDRFHIGDGIEREYHYVHTNGSTMVIPVTSDNKIILIKQYRYLNRMESYEFPSGSVEDGLTIIENAQKELREETGFRASNLIKIGFFAPYTGASDEICTVFKGTGLVPDPLKSDATEDFEIHEFNHSEISEMAEKNIIWDGLSLSAWMLAKNTFNL